MEVEENTLVKVNFRNVEKLVVFDFDDTLYTHSAFGKSNSCWVQDCSSLFDFSVDPIFVQKSIKTLIDRGVHVGIASFGKKSLIIASLNKIIGRDYFNEFNVMTVPDLEDEWKKQLPKISKTYRDYMKSHDGNEDAAFQAFLKAEQPDKMAKYFCVKLPSSAKYEMIDRIRNHYSCKERIGNHEIRYFDDDRENINYALSKGIMAHHVPRPGFTEEWWLKESENF